MGLSKLGQGQCRLDISDSIEFIAGFYQEVHCIAETVKGRWRPQNLQKERLTKDVR